MTKEALLIKIEEQKKAFDTGRKKFRSKHLITRRMGSTHGFLFLVMLLLACTVELTSLSVQIEHTVSMTIPLIAWVVVVIASLCLKRGLKLKLLLINAVSIVVYFFILVTFKTSDMVVLLAGLFLLVYLSCYLINKQHGYTRAWARNETYYYLLVSLEWEVDQHDGKNNISSNLKLDELSLKFTQIIDAQLRERQRDIIGDYLTTNDAAFSWIKSIKK